MDTNQLEALKEARSEAMRDPDGPSGLPAKWWAVIVVSVVGLLLAGFFLINPCAMLYVKSVVKLGGQGLDMVCQSKDGRCSCVSPDGTCSASEDSSPSCGPRFDRANPHRHGDPVRF